MVPPSGTAQSRAGCFRNSALTAHGLLSPVLTSCPVTDIGLMVVCAQRSELAWFCMCVFLFSNVV